MRTRGWYKAGVAGLAVAGCCSSAAVAQTVRPAGNAPQAEQEGSDEDSSILVIGRLQPGSAIGDLPPVQQLNAGDVRAIGVSSVAELLTELAPQTRSGQGRGGGPVTLLNGRRISGFSEIRDIPAEAIQRVDILPEEVALQYGYSADQKVVNIVLRRRFRSVTGELEGGTTTQGGGHSGEIEFNLLHIARDRRLNLNIEYNASEAISEADRDLISRSGGRAFDRVGNIVGIPNGTQIDPALSTLAGVPVTVAGVPASAANGAPTLGSFVPTANRANVTDVGRFRTIRPETRQLDVNAVYARTVLGNVGATVNATLNVTDSDSLRGQPGASLTLPTGNAFSPFGRNVILLRYLGDRALTQAVDGVIGHLGVTLDKDFGKWRTSLTSAYDHGDTRTVTVRGIDVTSLQTVLNSAGSTVNPFGTIPAALINTRLVDRARVRTDSGNLQFVANGPLFSLPAGTANTSFKAGIDALRLDAVSVRAGVRTAADLSRTDINGRWNIDLPITSRRENILGAIGDLSFNANAAFDRYSDFGTLGSYGYGATWEPRKGINLIASVTHDRTPPSIQQLGNPVVLTPDVRTFDYQRGITIDIPQLTGGNPALLADRRRVMKFGFTLKPFKADITLSADYVNRRTRKATASFPEPTAAIEAAFPDRFLRDTDGSLLRIDARPINYERQSGSELRWGINFTHRLKTSERLVEAMRNSPRLKEEMERRRTAFQAREGAAQGGAGQGGQGGGQGGQVAGGVGRGGGPGGPGGFRGGPGGGGPGAGGRLNFSLYHTWHFMDEVLIRRGLPVLDLLNGDAIGANGGTSQHEVEAQFGYANNGIGARINANWRSGTTVDAVTGLASGDLRFSPLTTVNARLFINLGQQIGLLEKRWAQGMRIQLRVDNLFDSHLKVRDATGATPLRYQAGYLDPTGRTIRIQIRKLFL